MERMIELMTNRQRSQNQGMTPRVDPVLVVHIALPHYLQGNSQIFKKKKKVEWMRIPRMI